MNSLLYAFAHIYRNDTNRPLYDQKSLMGDDTTTYDTNNANMNNDPNYQNANMQTLATQNDIIPQQNPEPTAPIQTEDPNNNLQPTQPSVQPQNHQEQPSMIPKPPKTKKPKNPLPEEQQQFHQQTSEQEQYSNSPQQEKQEKVSNYYQPQTTHKVDQKNFALQPPKLLVNNIPTTYHLEQRSL